MRRRFDGVDVIVIRAEVARVAAQDAFERRDDLLGALRRLPLRVPELPRVQIHEALGVERGGVEVIGMSGRDVVHGARIVDGQRLQIRVRVIGIAVREGVDVGTLVRARRRGERARALHRGVRRLLTLGVDVEIDVRAECERDAPGGHRRLRIELRRAGERAHGLVVIEGV